jgi:hypothetical protein
VALVRTDVSEEHMKGLRYLYFFYAESEIATRSPNATPCEHTAARGLASG